MSTVSVSIDAELFARLQKVAVPLVDDLNSVITKLLDHWDALPLGPYQGQIPLPHDPLMTQDRLDEFVDVTKRANENLERNLQLAKMLSADPNSELVATWGKLSELLAAGPSRFKGRHKTRDATMPHVPPAEEVFGYEARPTHFLTSKGVALPVGMRLFADYQGKRLNAVVTQYGIEFDGKQYNNPSQAAMAAKQLMGASPKASSTNGWTFWLIDEPTFELAAKTLDHFRQAAGQKLYPDDGSEE